MSGNSRLDCKVPKANIDATYSTQGKTAAKL